MSRAYHPNGLLLSETQTIKTRSRTGTSHAYSVAYTYDRNGRRTSRTLSPSSLFAGSAMSYGYASWGAPSSVTDIAGNAYRFDYTAKRELLSVGYPAGIAQGLGYDGASRLNSDSITRPGAPTAFPYYPSATVRQFRVSSRNARGQIVTAADGASAGNGYPTATYGAWATSRARS